MIFLFASYATILTAAFFFLRARTWTDELAAPPEDKKPGFGPRITLLPAAEQFLKNGGPRVLIVAVTISFVARCYIGQWSWWDVFVSLGILVSWPFQEWVIHKYLEHFPPVTLFGRKMELVITRTHRAHHRNPWDPKFGLITPHFIVLLVGGVPLVWTIGVSLPIALTGITLTYTLILTYEWVHFLIHTSYAPKSRLYRRLWKNHRLHHFQNERYWYGLTMLSGDKLLYTFPDSQDTPHSSTCMNLGVKRELIEWTDS